MDLRTTEAPLKQRCEDAEASRVPLRARGGEAEGPITCSVDLGRAVLQTLTDSPRIERRLASPGA
jgi:hypothetical protein